MRNDFFYRLSSFRLQSVIVIENEQESADKGERYTDGKCAVKTILGSGKISGYHGSKQGAEIPHEIVNSSDTSRLPVRCNITRNGPDIGSPESKDAGKGAEPENSPKSGVSLHAKPDEQCSAEHSDSHTRSAKFGYCGSPFIPFIENLSAEEFCENGYNVGNGCSYSHFFQRQSSDFH